MTASATAGFILTSEERQAVMAYLRSLYAGVFTDAAIEAHLENHVGFAATEYEMAVIKQGVGPGARLLDVGSGFGSCVLAARQKGIDAIGIEMSPFEVEFARRRLKNVRPNDDPEQVYPLGSVFDVDAPLNSFDAITFWNVLEHIENLAEVLSLAKRLLKNGGIVYIVCPNYSAWRQEAHYHVPWKPNFLMSKEQGVAYLKSLGRDPLFFETSIFRRTNWEVLGALLRLNFELRDIGTLRSMHPLSNLLAMLRQPVKFLKFYNPLCHSVVLAATKR